MSYVALALALAFTVAAQLLLKARANVHAGESALQDTARYMFAVLTDIGAIAALGLAGLAALCWILAVERITLGFAYPFMALSFVCVPILGVYFLGEPLKLLQIPAFLLIVAGVGLSAWAN